MPTSPPAAPGTPRRFASLTRTINYDGTYEALDAIDTDGRAWRLVASIDPGPRGRWAEIKPLPTYEEQP